MTFLNQRNTFTCLSLFCLLGLFVHFISLTDALLPYEKMIYTWANDLSRDPKDPPYLSLYYRLRTRYFAMTSHADHPIVFLGDSITDDGDWKQLFPTLPVENRGIGGDTTLGVLNRLDEVIKLQPTKIFIMIGTNDLCYDRPIPAIRENYVHILSRLHRELPQTAIYIESVLPFNDTLFPSRALRSNDNILELDHEIKELAALYNDPYIDLTPAFTGADKRLLPQYTTDGLHLNPAGYLVWKSAIEELLPPSQLAAQTKR